MQFFVRKQASFATMHDVGIPCVDFGYVALPTAQVTCSPTLFFWSRHVRAAYSAVDFTDTGKKLSGFRRYDLEIKVACDFSVTQKRISISLGVSSTSWVLEESSPAALAMATAATARGTKLLLWMYHCRSNSSVVPLQVDLP